MIPKKIPTLMNASGPYIKTAHILTNYSLNMRISLVHIMAKNEIFAREYPEMHTIPGFTLFRIHLLINLLSNYHRLVEQVMGAAYGERDAYYFSGTPVLAFL